MEEAVLCVLVTFIPLYANARKKLLNEKWSNRITVAQ